MFSSLTVSNFLSFEDKQTFSMEHAANTSQNFQDNAIYNYVDNNGKKRYVLKNALIFGSNASGKSNLLEAFKVIKEITLNSHKYSNTNDYPEALSPFLFKERLSDSPISFDLELIIPIWKQIDERLSEEEKLQYDYLIKKNSETESDYKVRYQIELDPESFSIKYEKLSYNLIKKSSSIYRESKIESTVFERRNLELLSSHSSLKNIINSAIQDNIEYQTILSKIVYDRNINLFKKEIDGNVLYAVLLTLGHEIQNGFNVSDPSGDSFSKFSEALNTDESFKDKVISTLIDFDFAIKDIQIKDNTESFIFNLKRLGLSDEKYKEIESSIKKQRSFDVYTIHETDDKYPLKLKHESNGTKKFLESSLHYFSAFDNSALFISDEFDSKYHPKIQESLLQKFNTESKSFSQFIISTHNPLLMNSLELAKENIFFIEKDSDTQSSQIYSLSEFKDVTYDNHNWMNLYLSGRLGAIPEVF